MAESVFEYQEPFTKVITEGDGRVFHAVGTVLIIDGEEYGWENPVSVLSASGLKLGFANLAEEEGRIVATMFLNHHIPERMDIENNDSLYVRPVFHSRFDGGLRTRSIIDLHLGPEAPLDDRILPVRVQS